MYFAKEVAAKQRGSKRMKFKDRATLMVCFNVEGNKCPLAMIDEAVKPACFALRNPPIAYKNQTNAWFDKDITH